jgi:riboflavin-specific deaminase-like protein
LVGVDTVLQDDPQLTVRHVRGQNPIRIVLDSRLRIPRDAKILEVEEGRLETWVVTTGASDPRGREALKGRGVRILECSQVPTGRMDIAHLLEMLGRSGISSLLVEGGGKVLTSFLREGSVQRLVCFVAPILLGKGVEAVGNLGIRRVDEAIRFASWRLRRSGRDLVLDALL